jgi:hypothetical protein
MNTNLEVKAMPNETPYDIDIGSVTRESTGNVSALIHGAIRGKNWLGGIPKIPSVSDDGGLIFITKPDFNLKASNIGSFRHFSPLLNTNKYSIGAALRDCLDPRSVHESGKPNSALNDYKNPFLSVLDNTLISLDGWPDFVVNEFVSNPGKRGATYGMMSGTIQDALKYTISMSNRNIPGDVVNHLINFWLRLGSQIHKDIYPHEINVWKDQISYASRVYRFVFDSTGTRLSQFTMCGYSYPTSSSIGAVMGYNANDNRNQGYDEISSSWSAYGVFHNDSIVIDEFNRTVYNFNPGMHDKVRDTLMTKVGQGRTPSRNLAGAFNGYGYPRINPRTLEFEIWVPNNTFALLATATTGEDISNAIRLKMLSDYNKGITQLTPEEKAKLFG